MTATAEGGGTSPRWITSLSTILLVVYDFSIISCGLYSDWVVLGYAMKGWCPLHTEQDRGTQMVGPCPGPSLGCHRRWPAPQLGGNPLPWGWGESQLASSHAAFLTAPTGGICAEAEHCPGSALSIHQCDGSGAGLVLRALRAPHAPSEVEESLDTGCQTANKSRFNSPGKYSSTR